MEEEIGRSWKSEKSTRMDAYSQIVRADRRTYFLDVKTTPEEEDCLIITESKKCTDAEGHFFYEKHRIYIYPEDLESFLHGLSNVSWFLRNRRGNSFTITKKILKTSATEKDSFEEDFSEVHGPGSQDEAV